MTDDTTADDVERVERTDIGASVEARLKRGTGTRDEDKITIKAKGETAADALEEFEMLAGDVCVRCEPTSQRLVSILGVVMSLVRSRMTTESSCC